MMKACGSECSRRGIVFVWFANGMERAAFSANSIFRRMILFAGFSCVEQKMENERQYGNQSDSARRAGGKSEWKSV